MAVVNNFLVPNGVGPGQLHAKYSFNLVERILGATKKIVSALYQPLTFTSNPTSLKLPALGGFRGVKALGSPKSSRRVRFFGLPKGKDNSKPVIGQSSQSNTVALALGSLTLVVLCRPFFLLGR